MKGVLLVLLVVAGSRGGQALGRGKGGRSTQLPPPPLPEGEHLPPERWFNQTLDHFAPTDNRTWQQRYFLNATFYKPGGPVLLLIGGEGPASPAWMVTAQPVQLAKKLHGYLLQLEHRFYGKSHPTKDASVENLAYLSSEQALADLATFTQAMKQHLGLTANKWIALGGSYPGSLAAWYRLKYPHLVHGAVATSAPILAQLNFKEYLEVVRDSLATVDEGCNVAISRAHRDLRNLLQERKGWSIINKEFRLCTPLDGHNRFDVANLFSVLAGNVEDVVQYNRDNRAFEGVKGTDITIDTVCEIMMNDTMGSYYIRYASLNSLLLDVAGEKCLDHTYSSMVKELKSVAWKEQCRAWLYQTCTEFGFYQTSDALHQPFGYEFPLQFFTGQCQDVFGSRFTEKVIRSGIQRTNTLYGGYDLKVTRVVFPNGAIDPWHALGVTTDLSSGATALFINGTAHCANMYPASPGDPTQLIQAREQILALIQQWLKE
ncbi:putative serine protease K12H4.7 [Chionoecetes opilio]|uniref:Putative serine protease K12H4.7 n=1 Tax=Chionoecetes opilio TaxID=41210 RepID=A0A8J4Y936_CHIOP|nr:putative serine protease K12H4.7 [Chionoecetes opilio]